MKYRLLIDYEVIEFIEKLSRKDQQLLRSHLVAIQDYPGRYSDYDEHDSEGRRVDIHIFTFAANTPSSFGKIMPTNT